MSKKMKKNDDFFEKNEKNEKKSEKNEKNDDFF